MPRRWQLTFGCWLGPRGSCSTSPRRYLPLWKYSVPPSFRDRDWDFSRFNEGEHFVYERFPIDKYLELMDQMRRWGLDDVMDRKQYEQLVLAPA